MADLKQTLKEADKLLRIARTALQRMRLEGLGSDCRLSHEVRMFALEFSRESRDGPGALQVNGTGRALKCLDAIRASLAQAEPVAWRTFDGEGGLAAGVNPSFLDVSRATEQFVKPTRSQQMADAGFTPRDNRLQCDECGGKFSRQMLPIHNCPQQTEPLTDEEILNIIDDTLEGGSLVDIARAVEAAHGIKEAK